MVFQAVNIPGDVPANKRPDLSLRDRGLSDGRAAKEVGVARSKDLSDPGRRNFLQCMAWVGTGAVWTLSGGILKGSALGQAAHGSMISPASGGLRFVQISDSHIGFDKPANTDVTATLREAIAKIKAEPEPPAFVLHTGDLTHLSKPAEFDTLQQVLSDFEWRVLTGYQVGKSYREIATELRCKTKSVDNALARIKRKVAGIPVGDADLSTLLQDAPLT